MFQPSSLVLVGDVTLHHVLYISKHLLGSRRVLDANRFAPMGYLTGLFATFLVGEAGGLFVPMSMGKPAGSFKEEYKVICVILAWTFMWFMPLEAKKQISKFLTTKPYNFIVVIPNEYRRALGLCSNVRNYSSRATEDNKFLMPVLVSGITLCMGSLLFPFIAQVLPNYEATPAKSTPSILSNPPWRMRIPFICAFFLNMCIIYNLRQLFPFEPELLVACTFMAVPVFEWITQPKKSESKVQ